MTIFHHHIDEDGSLRFFVTSKSFPLIVAHLKQKGLNAGGTHNPTADENEIWLEGTVEQANEALADFDEMNEIRKRNKAKQAELERDYPKQIILLCETPSCKNTVTFKDESEMRKALDKGKPYCGECFSKKLAA